jgi:hypothetical protein
MDFFATQIDAGQFGRSIPVCRADLASASPTDEEGRIVLPNSDLQRQIRAHAVQKLKALAHRELPGYSPFAIAAGIGQPTREQFVEYNNRVDQYNQEIEVFRREIGSHIARVVSISILRFGYEMKGVPRQPTLY